MNTPAEIESELYRLLDSRERVGLSCPTKRIKIEMRIGVVAHEWSRRADMQKWAFSCDCGFVTFDPEDVDRIYAKDFGLPA